MKIKKITKVKRSIAVPVYDLSVLDTENFCLGNGCVVHNSKDRSDSATGVIYGLTMRREIWVKHGIPLVHIPDSLRNKSNTSKNAVED